MAGAPVPNGWVEEHEGYSSGGTGGLLLRHGAETILTTRALRLMAVSQRNVLLFLPQSPREPKEHQGITIKERKQAPLGFSLGC